nr:putative lrr receptor-like serine/threonine-protein kinase [Quercus suber]
MLELLIQRKSSRHALCFLLWGCAILCLPKPPPHHIPKLTATEFVGAVRGAWKQTGAAVSHDPKAKEYLDLPEVMSYVVDLELKHFRFEDLKVVCEEEK